MIPVLIGLAVAVFMILKDINEPVFQKVEIGTGTHVWHDSNADKTVEASELLPVQAGESADFLLQSQTQIWNTILHNWQWTSTLAILGALLMVFCRDLAYMYRIRLLTEKQLSWRQSFQVIILWEFSSALTPSVVGGSAVALFILAQEKISAGRSTAIVMITALLDEMFYIISVPIAFLFVGMNTLFIKDFNFTVFGLTLKMEALFFLGFGFICLLTLIILLAIIIRPVTAKRIMGVVCSLKPLKRFRRKALKVGDDIIVTSKYLKTKPFSFWGKAFGATMLSWTARFFVVNFLILAFNSSADQIMIFARQLVMWVILLISPTPGGSGIAEFAFPIFLKEFIPTGIGPALALLWRFLTYYPYIIVGAIILPIWLRRVLKNRRKA